MAIPAGVPVHGEFSSADASALSEANSRILLYGAASTTAVTLDAKSTVQVTHLSISTEVAPVTPGAGLTVTVYDGADATPDAGEVLFKGVIPNYALVAFEVPHYCQYGTWPKVKTNAAGQVYVQMHGTVYTRTP